NSDGTVDGEYVIAVDESIFDTGILTRDAFREQLATDFDDVPEGTEVEVEEYDEDGFYGARVRFEHLPAEELSQENTETGTEADLSLVREGDTFVFHAVMDFSAGGDLGEDNPFGDAVLNEAEARVQITFPGRVLEHNGRLEGTTVTWELDPAAAN